MLGRQFVKAVVSAVARPLSTLSSFSSRCCLPSPLSRAVVGISSSLNLRRSLPPLVMALSTLSSGGCSAHTTSSAAVSSVPVALSDLTLVGQDASVAIDQDLFESFSVDSLMELAGLSVAEATLKSFPPGAHERVLVVVGPGNNGGDGLVAARHLRHFGYKEVALFYPKQSDKPLFQHLLRQNQDLGNAVESLENPGAIVPSTQADFDAAFDLVIDAVFGFSFRGTPREPFVQILELMSKTSLPVISVDVPSGYDSWFLFSSVLGSESCAVLTNQIVHDTQTQMARRRWPN